MKKLNLPTILVILIPHLIFGQVGNTWYGNGTGNAGVHNTSIGNNSGASLTNSAVANSLLGSFSGRFLSSGHNNVLVGYSAGSNLTVGSHNVFLGHQSGNSNNSGENNVFAGKDSGLLNTGSGNVFLGTSSGNSSEAGSFNVFIGNNAGYNETGSNKLYIDNSNTTTPLIYGDFSSSQLTVHGRLGIGIMNPTKQLEVNGDILLRNETGLKQIYTWNGEDENWRIGMNDTPGFVRGLATSYVQYITYRSNPGQGFAIGVNGGNSSFEIAGSNHTAFFRGSVGIGTTSPTYKLDVNGALNATEIRLNGEIFNPTVWTQSGADINYLQGTVGIGTATVPTGYRLAVDGNIMAEEIQIQLSHTWPDYVFEEDYDLKPLSEVEAFVKANKHLPEVPSAKEVASEGQRLGEMNAILLKKVEELTLYLIRQQATIEAQENKIEELYEMFRKGNE